MDNVNVPPTDCENDVTPPVAGILSNVNVSIREDGSKKLSAADMAFIGFLSSDNCGIASYSVTPNTFSCEDIGMVEITLTVTDFAGNSASTKGFIRIYDGFNPRVTLKSTSVYLDQEGKASIEPADVIESASDNCGIASYKVSPSTFTCEDFGQIKRVTVRVIDNNGIIYENDVQVTVRGSDNDQDGIADPCDEDEDDDGIDDEFDNCPLSANADQADLDLDGTGDACDEEMDIGGATINLASQIGNSGMKNGLQNSYLDQLQEAGTACSAGDPQGAIEKLQGFIKHVRAQRGKKGFSTSAADQIISDAERIIAAIQKGTANCGGGALIQSSMSRHTIAHSQASLLGNFPNPFSSETTIRFYLPQEEQVTLTVYDMMGRELIRLVDGPMLKGEHQVSWTPASQHEGIYLCRMQAGALSITKKMMVRK